MQNNRDLYVFVKELIARQKDSDRSLRDWLGGFFAAIDSAGESDKLPLMGFAVALDAGFDLDPVLPDEDDDWTVAQVIRRQMLAMEKAAATGILENEQRHFGMGIPDGGYWYNWDPIGFIECGVAGSFGGWAPGDDTRIPVPGVEAAADEVVDMPDLSWDQVEHFLEMGQSYE